VGTEQGAVAVHEILLKHDALPNTIRTGKISAIRGIIESSTKDAMCLMDNSIMERYQNGEITAGEAYMKATDKERFKNLAEH
jgi:twitching motility protein PilT